MKTKVDHRDKNICYFYADENPVAHNASKVEEFLYWIHILNPQMKFRFEVRTSGTSHMAFLEYKQKNRPKDSYTYCWMVVPGKIQNVCMQVHESSGVSIGQSMQNLINMISENHYPVEYSGPHQGIKVTIPKVCF